jgi:hypothetical protein
VGGTRNIWRGEIGKTELDLLVVRTGGTLFPDWISPLPFVSDVNCPISIDNYQLTILSQRWDSKNR